MSKNFKQLWKESKSTNPWAVCHSTVDKDANPDKYERCVKDVKKQNEEKDPCWDGYEQVGNKDKGGKEVPNCVPVNEQTDVEPIIDGGDNATDNAMEPGTGLEDINTKDIVQSDLMSPSSDDLVNPETNNDFTPDPESSDDVVEEPIEDMEAQIAEAYAKKISKLKEKKNKLEEELNGLMQEIEKNSTLGQKKFQYDEARENAARLREELKSLKEGDDEKIEGGYADDWSVEDIANKHNVSVEDIQKQLEIGIKIEYEHTNDEQEAREIALDHIYENPKYYDNTDGTDLVDMEKEAKKDDNKKLDEGKKDKKKNGPVKSINKELGEREPIGKYGKTKIKSTKDKDRDPKQRRRKDKQNNYDNLSEGYGRTKYFKESWKRVKRDDLDTKEKRFNFNVG